MFFKQSEAYFMNSATAMVSLFLEQKDFKFKDLWLLIYSLHVSDGKNDGTRWS